MADSNGQALAITTALSCLVAGAGFLLFQRQQQTRRQRKWWVKPWIARREHAGNIHLVHNELRVEDEASYINYLRMDPHCFETILNLISPHITKRDTRLRQAITARQKLIVTLRFLASGESYRSLMYQFRISESTISLFIPEVCQQIYEKLKHPYLQCPQTAAEWLNISQNFERRWNLPNVIAAMDGKHIQFKAPKDAGSTFFNYKGYNSIVLLALVDYNYRFLYVDVGTNGRISDGGVFMKSNLYNAIQNDKINIPEPKPFPGCEKCIPHVIVADAAFPLSTNILKPYPFRNMTREQRIFNYRLSRARNVVENAFGILTNRFRVLLSTINLSANKAEIITLTCCALHNFLKENSKNYMTSNPDKEVESKFTFTFGLSQQMGNRHRNEALEIRQAFCNYVNGIGSVPWQANK